jgi:hypothetical protein
MYHDVAGLALSLKANDLADSGFTVDSFCLNLADFSLG